MQGNYTIGTTRTMTILDQLHNPVEGYQISFTWTDDNVDARNSYVQVEKRAASRENVDRAIREEIERIESWLS